MPGRQKMTKELDLAAFSRTSGRQQPTGQTHRSMRLGMGRSVDIASLPSGPAPKRPGEERGGYGSRDRRGGGRDDRDNRSGGWGRDRDERGGNDGGDEYVSRAETADRWRSGPSSRGGGGDRGSNGMGAFSSAFGGRDRDSGFGGNDDGRDTRPAHLRRRGGGGSNDVRSQGHGNAFDLLSDDSKRSRQAARKNIGKSNDSKNQAPRTVEYDESIASAKTISKEDAQNPITDAVKTGTNINSVKELVKGLGLLSLDQESPDSVDQIGNVISKSIGGNYFSVEELLEQTATLVPDAAARSAFLCACLKNLARSKGDIYLRDAVQGIGGGELLEHLSQGKSGEDLGTFLKEQDLIVLQPVDTESKAVTTALSSQKPKEALAAIEGAYKTGIPLDFLLEAVVESLAQGLFTPSKSISQLGFLEAYQGVWQRVVSTTQLEDDALALLVQKWADMTNKDKVMVLPIFQELHRLEMVSYYGFSQWQTSLKNKSKAKMAVILIYAVSEFIASVEPKEEYDEEADEDEEEDEEEDFRY